MDAYLALIDGPKLLTLAGLIALDFVLGVVVALFAKTFQWSKLTSYLNTSIIQLGLGYALVGAFVLAEPTYAWALTATWGIIDAKLIADIVEKLKKLGVIIKPPA